MIFLGFCSIPEGKYPIVMTRSILERNFCDVITANNVEFCVFTSVIHTIIGTKFQINALTISLFSGSGSERNFQHFQHFNIVLDLSTICYSHFSGR